MDTTKKDLLAYLKNRITRSLKKNVKKLLFKHQALCKKNINNQ